MLEKMHKKEHKKTDRKDIRDQSLSRVGNRQNFIRAFPENCRQTQHLRAPSELSQQVYPSGLRDALTEPKLQGIILRSMPLKSGRKGDCQMEQDYTPVSMNDDSHNESYHSVSRSPLPNPASSSQSLESNTWHEQRMVIEQQGIKIANLGQKLESCGIRVRKILDGYFPTMADTLRLTEQQFIEYENKKKVDVENLHRELKQYEFYLKKYITRIRNYVDQFPELINLKNLNKYKKSLKNHEASLTPLQTALKEFSEQFSNEKKLIQNILKAAQEIVDTHKQARDIADNPELAQDIAANSQLARKILAKSELAEFIQYGSVGKDVARNEKLVQDIVRNEKLVQDVTNNMLAPHLPQKPELVKELVDEATNNPHCPEYPEDITYEQVRCILDHPQLPRITQHVVNNPKLVERLVNDPQFTLPLEADPMLVKGIKNYYKPFLHEFAWKNLIQYIKNNPAFACDISKILNLPQNIAKNLELPQYKLALYKLSQCLKDNPTLAQEIAKNLELAQEIAKNPTLAQYKLAQYKLARYKLGQCLKDNPMLTQEIAKNLKLARYILDFPKVARDMLNNFDLIRDIDANRGSCEKILENSDIAKYIVNHIDVFQSINSVVTMKKNALLLFSKLLETERMLSQFRKTTILDLLADLRKVS